MNNREIGAREQRGLRPGATAEAWGEPEFKFGLQVEKTDDWRGDILPPSALGLNSRGRSIFLAAKPQLVDIRQLGLRVQLPKDYRHMSLPGWEEWLEYADANQLSSDMCTALKQHFIQEQEAVFVPSQENTIIIYASPLMSKNGMHCLLTHEYLHSVFNQLRNYLKNEIEEYALRMFYEAQQNKDHLLHQKHIGKHIIYERIRPFSSLATPGETRSHRFATESYAYLGSEIPYLKPNIEQYYRPYFQNRQQTVRDFYDQLGRRPEHAILRTPLPEEGNQDVLPFARRELEWAYRQQELAQSLRKAVRLYKQWQKEEQPQIKIALNSESPLGTTNPLNYPALEKLADLTEFVEDCLTYGNSALATDNRQAFEYLLGATRFLLIETVRSMIR